MIYDKHRTKRIQQNSHFPYLILFVSLIFPCPLFFTFGITGKIVALILLFLFLFSTIVFNTNICHIKQLVFCSISTMMFGCVTAFHYLDVTYIFILMIYIGYSFFFCLVEDGELIDFVNIASKFIFILEIGAIIGFVYAYIGGQPIASIKNIDGRSNYLYLTTLTNARLGRFIRPAGIYDEPGAFSFYIVSIVLMRMYYKKNTTFTFIILLLGMVTTSLTHFLCMAILLIPILRKSNRKQKIVIFLIFAIILFLALNLFYDLFDKFLFQRLQYDNSKGTIQGNSRDGQIEGCLKSIRDNGFLFGNYLLGPDRIKYRYGVISENPLSPITMNGLFNSMPYYVFIVITFTAFIFSFNSCYLAAFALFLQRPYQSAIGYSFFFIFFLIIAFDEIKQFVSRHKKIFKIYA